MEKPIRSFFAIEIEGPLRVFIEKTQTQLKHEIPFAVRWVKTNNIHITIKFIERLDPSHISILQERLGGELDSMGPFSIQPSDMGVFPNRKNPRVIWMGISYPRQLDQIYKAADQVFQKLGYQPEGRGFRPHLTLGRIKKPLAQEELRNLLLVLDALPIQAHNSMQASTIKLFKSELSPAGPVYSELFSIQLQAEP